MNIGDKVVRKSYDKDIIFKIIDIEVDSNGKKKYLLKGLNIRIEADSVEDDLELSDDGEKDKIFNKKVYIIKIRKNRISCSFLLFIQFEIKCINGYLVNKIK